MSLRGEWRNRRTRSGYGGMISCATLPVPAGTKGDGRVRGIVGFTESALNWSVNGAGQVGEWKARRGWWSRVGGCSCDRVPYPGARTPREGDGVRAQGGREALQRVLFWGSWHFAKTLIPTQVMKVAAARTPQMVGLARTALGTVHYSHYMMPSPLSVGYPSASPICSSGTGSSCGVRKVSRTRGYSGCCVLTSTQPPRNLVVMGCGRQQASEGNAGSGRQSYPQM